MCTVIPGDCGCHGSSSSGVTAEGALAVGVILATVTAAGAVFQKLWIPLGVALVLGWLLYWRATRRATLVVCALAVTGALWLARLALKRLRKKPYRATLYITGPDGRPVQLGSGDVPGRWRRRTAVEGAAMRRYVEVYGYPTAGVLCCRADPVDGGR